jgi:hypothetical protein
VRHVDDQVAHDGQAGQRLQHDRILQRAHVGEACEAVLAVDISTSESYTGPSGVTTLTFTVFIFYPPGKL